MNYANFIKNCKELIVEMGNNYSPTIAELKDISEDDIYEVWFAQNLITFRALLSTNIINGVYFEIIYNEKSGVFDLRTYQKLTNIVQHTEFEDNKIFTTKDFINYCKEYIKIYDVITKIDTKILGIDKMEDITDIDIILHAKALMNHKMVLKASTPSKNTHLLFEITSNGAKNEVYHDIYKMVDFHIFNPKYPAR